MKLEYKGIIKVYNTLYYFSFYEIINRISVNYLYNKLYRNYFISNFGINYLILKNEVENV